MGWYIFFHFYYKKKYDSIALIFCKRSYRRNVFPLKHKGNYNINLWNVQVCWKIIAESISLCHFKYMLHVLSLSKQEVVAYPSFSQHIYLQNAVEIQIVSSLWQEMLNIVTKMSFGSIHQCSSGFLISRKIWTLKQTYT